MLGGVVLVQQIEAHVLQPFLMGRFVSVHPLGVIVAIACGVLVAGIAGALIAVPLAAAVNAVVQYLAANTRVGDDADEALDEDLATDGIPPDRVPEDDGPRRVRGAGGPPRATRRRPRQPRTRHDRPVTLADIEAARRAARGRRDDRPRWRSRAGSPPWSAARSAQVREPPAHRLLQDPRRLRAHLAARRGGARPRRRRRLGRQPRAGRRPRRASCSASRHGLHAGGRADPQGQRHPRLRRRGGLRGPLPRGLARRGARRSPRRPGRC